MTRRQRKRDANAALKRVFAGPWRWICRRILRHRWGAPSFTVYAPADRHGRVITCSLECSRCGAVASAKAFVSMYEMVRKLSTHDALARGRERAYQRAMAETMVT